MGAHPAPGGESDAHHDETGERRGGAGHFRKGRDCPALAAGLVHAVAQRGKRYGLQTMCEGGGTANVTIIERL